MSDEYNENDSNNLIKTNPNIKYNTNKSEIITDQLKRKRPVTDTNLNNDTNQTDDDAALIDDNNDLNDKELNKLLQADNL